MLQIDPHRHCVCVNIPAIKAIIEDLLIIEEDQPFREVMSAFLRATVDLFIFDDLNHMGFFLPLWKKIFSLLEDARDSEMEQLCLGCIRILSRNFDYLDATITQNDIDILLKYSNVLAPGPIPDTDGSVLAAIKTLNNIIYKSPVGIAMIQERDCLDKVIVTKEEHDSKLMTNLKIFDMQIPRYINALFKRSSPVLEERYGLNEIMKKIEYVEDSAKPLPYATAELQTLCGLLKLVYEYNNDLTGPKFAENCLCLVQLMRRLMLAPSLNDIMTVELQITIIDVLTKVPGNYYPALIIPFKRNEKLPEHYKYDKYNMKVVCIMVQFLQHYLDQASGTPEKLIPILTVLLRLASSVKLARKFLRILILPSIREVNRMPERSKMLSVQLCHLLAAPSVFINETIANLLLILCKENVGRLIKHIGYGNTAGILAICEAQAKNASKPTGTTEPKAEEEDDDDEVPPGFMLPNGEITGIPRPFTILGLKNTASLAAMTGANRDTEPVNGAGPTGMKRNFSSQGAFGVAGTSGSPEEKKHVKTELKDEPDIQIKKEPQECTKVFISWEEPVSYTSISNMSVDQKEYELIQLVKIMDNLSARAAPTPPAPTPAAPTPAAQTLAAPMNNLY